MQIIIKTGKRRERSPSSILSGKCHFCILKNQPTLLCFRKVIQLGQRRLVSTQPLMITVYENVKCNSEFWMVSPWESLSEGFS